MDEEVFLDSDRLKEHADQLQEQRVQAGELYDLLNALKLVALPDFQARYGQLMQEAQEMEMYYQAMSRAIRDLGDDTERCARRISQMLQNSDASSRVHEILRVD